MKKNNEYDCMMYVYALNFDYFHVVVVVSLTIRARGRNTVGSITRSIGRYVSGLIIEAA